MYAGVIELEYELEGFSEVDSKRWLDQKERSDETRKMGRKCGLPKALLLCRVENSHEVIMRLFLLSPRTSAAFLFNS